MKKTIIFLLSLVLLTSCSKTNEIDKATSPVDSLITVWNSAWAAKDSLALKDMFLTDATLIDDNIVALNQEEIYNQMILVYVNVVRDLKTEKLSEWYTANNAAYVGKYSLNVVVNDTIVAQPTGAFTFNWIKDDKGNWRISNGHIHSFKPE